MKNGKYQTETEREALKQKTKFRAWIRNTEKKEITEADIYLEHRESSNFDNEEINIVIHDIRDYTNTDEQYHDVRIECSGEEDENEIRQYLTDYWEANLPFEFFFMPETPEFFELGKQEYLVYTMSEEGITYKEIAQVLEITESTARGQYRNAKNKIAKEELKKTQLKAERDTVVEEIQKVKAENTVNYKIFQNAYHEQLSKFRTETDQKISGYYKKYKIVEAKEEKEKYSQMMEALRLLQKHIDALYRCVPSWTPSFDDVG